MSVIFVNVSVIIYLVKGNTSNILFLHVKMHFIQLINNNIQDKRDKLLGCIILY